LRPPVNGRLAFFRFSRPSIQIRGQLSCGGSSVVELCCFSRHHFEDLLHDQRLQLERTLDEVDAACEWMLVLGRNITEDKVDTLTLLIVQHVRVTL
jgi:hypothetical protein